MEDALYKVLNNLNEKEKKIESKLNGWEKRFLVDTLDRFREYGRRSFFTDKQEIAIFKIQSKYGRDK